MLYSYIANLFLSDNSVIATYRLLTLLNGKVSSRDVKDKILTHPDHGSLLAIYDTLAEFDFSPSAYEVEEKGLDNLSFPFIAQITSKNDFLFVVVKEATPNEFIFFDVFNKKRVLKRHDFLELWTGICLTVTNQNKDAPRRLKPDFKERRVVNYLSLLLIAFAIYFIVAYLFQYVSTSPQKYFWIIFLILKISGLIVTFILLWYEVDRFNPIIKNLCTTGNKKVNCSAVLNSTGSNLFGKFFSWSEIGFSYFFGSLCLLFIAYSNPKTIIILSNISLLSIPMILYSFIYQGLVVRQWCILCIAVQMVLIFEVLSVVFLSSVSIVFDINLLIILLFFCIFPIIIFKIGKSYLFKIRVNRFEKRKFNRLKSNQEVFLTLLSKSQHIGHDYNNFGISTTSPEAKYSVVKVCNPYCGPCSKAHSILNSLHDKKIIDLTIIFTSESDLSNFRNLPAFHFMALNKKNNHLAHEAMNFWYSLKVKEYELLQKSFPIQNIASCKKEVRQMNDWCQRVKINSTPTIFINDRKLPDIYDFNDLLLLLN